MATNFTNKYMHVFQNYNEFGEHSADYVRGEDHIAFLIEENEVIYWLYLEQVWRPLNVRTTTTGELEDGRTKVAVRLEYVEGGQKYTSVPNIPDPERITSMSRFLEDYPDIEEVNVTGTVNLTDLSYAFAGSKIKNFSLLDTSNVTNWSYFIYNLDDKTLEFNIKCDVPEFKSFSGPNLYNVKIKGITFTATNLVPNNPAQSNYLGIEENSDVDYVKGIGIQVNVAECTVGTLYSDVCSEIGFYARRQKLTHINTINCDKTTINLGRVSDVTHNGENLTLCLFETQDEYDFNYELDHKITTNAKNITLVKGKLVYNMPFGYGIKYIENANVIINTTVTIGNFYFTVPIVDDAFYAQYNIPISIFQYKTTFEEVADVNISKDVNPDLIYPSNYYNIGNWTENMNVEIYTNIPIPYTAITTVTFNKYILDNRSFNFTEDNCPIISDSAKRIFAKDEDSRISGVFKFGGDYGGFNTNETNLFKDITFYNVSRIGYRAEAGNYFKNNNIVIKNSFPYINIISSTSSELFLDVDNLVNDNILGNYIMYSSLHGNVHKIFFNYIENVNVKITKITGSSDYGFLKPYYYYILNSNIDNPIKLNAGDNSNAYFYWTFEGQTKDTKTYELNDCYIECDENSYIHNLDQYYIINTTVYYNRTMNANNIYGKVNIELNNYIAYSSTTNYIENKLMHIDLNKVKVNASEACILFYENLDDESTINLVTKLIDNTSSSTKTIYMYRSQANTVGEENIAAAVAKNYEFAIIEN